MYINITAQKLGTNYSQSSADFVDYLEKENEGLEKEEMEHIKADIIHKYENAEKTFADKELEEDDLEYLRLFSWICELAFDVYLKKQIIEQIIDELREKEPLKKKK